MTPQRRGTGQESASRRPKVLLDLQALQSDSRSRGIGNYTAGLADALLRRDEMEWHVLLSSEMDDTLAEARGWVETRLPASRIHVFHGLSPVRALEPDHAERSRAAEILYAGFVASLDVDLVHIASPFDGWGDNTTLRWDLRPSRARRVATVYDFIPAEKPETFLPTQLARDWYERRLRGVASADAVLAISDHTRAAALLHLGLSADAVTNIGADVSAAFHPRVLSAAARIDLLRSVGIEREFILHVGILEPRKNVPFLIKAFAMLDPALRDRHQIVLATSFTNRQKAEILAARRSCGLPPDAVVMPGFVPDDRLAELYSLAAVTVMPSKAEGFGLPLLEAMRCGCAVLASDTSSGPEVVGRSDLLFDPEDRSSLAGRLTEILGDADRRAEARQHGLDQARTFSWARSASLACAAFHRALETGRGDPVPEPYVERQVPWHPDRTSYKLMFGARTWPSRTKLASAAETQQQPVFLDVLTTSDAARGMSGPPYLELHLKAPRPRAEPEFWEPTGNVIGSLSPATIRGRRRSARVPAAMSRKLRAAAATWLKEPVLRSAAPLGWSLSLRGRSRTDERSDGPLAFGSLGDALAWVVDTHPLALADVTTDLLLDTADPSFLEDEAPAIAAAIADNHAPLFERKRLLVDVTELAQRDAGTGIQRVVRNIIATLLAKPQDFDVVPVRREEDLYRYARAFTARLQGAIATSGDAVVDFRCDDTFLGLDLDAGVSDEAARLLRRQHLRGVRIVHVVYDLLPIIRPDWFPENVDRFFERWTEAMAVFCDGIACISEATAGAVRDLGFTRRVDVGSFHLGADLDSGARPSTSPDPSPPRLLAGLTGPVFATVGTVEPRKGHEQLLDAAEHLWARGVEAGFIVVGRQGWRVDELASRIRSHPEFGQRLLWLEGASDETLTRVYERASAALLPSQGEGFGLPVVEAARFGLPLLVRDLPVFREIAGDQASYFQAENGRELADAITGWLDMFAAGSAPRSCDLKPLTWEESTEQLLAFVRSVAHRV